jgi:hypothetical protein
MMVFGMAYLRVRVHVHFRVSVVLECVSMRTCLLHIGTCTYMHKKFTSDAEHMRGWLATAACRQFTYVRTHIVT